MDEMNSGTILEKLQTAEGKISELEREVEQLKQRVRRLETNIPEPSY